MAEVRRVADAVGYPFMLKASWGGGGRGMRPVTRPEELEDKVLEGRREAQAAFGNGEGYLEKMILNAAFLVARDREADFDAKVKEIDARYENLKFKYTGPWPPYNFVNIRLKLERAAEAE